WIDRVSQERLAKLGTNDDRSGGREEADSTTQKHAPPRYLGGYTNSLAAKYPGDAGIERDPHVLFAENFETGDIEELSKRWTQVSNKDSKVVTFSSNVPPASPGKRSLQMTATLGENTGGHLYARLPRGVDKAFARFYVKFAADAPYIHHFVTLG